MLTNKIVGTVLASLGTALAAAAFTAALLLGAGTARAAVVDEPTAARWVVGQHDAVDVTDRAGEGVESSERLSIHDDLLRIRVFAEIA